MSQANIKEIIKQEYIKCATDPVHFFRKYCYITHPIKGRVLFHLYPMHEELQNGQLFYFTKIEKSGSLEIKVEPVDILEYPSLLKGYRLFARSGNSTHYSNSLKNAVMNRLDEYYDLVVLRELRNKKINIILE